jgi:hypothetical protein
MTSLGECFQLQIGVFGQLTAREWINAGTLLEQSVSASFRTKHRSRFWEPS